MPLPVLSVRDAALRLGESRSAVYYKILSGVLETIVVRGCYKIPLSVLDAYEAWRQQGLHGPPARPGEVTLQQHADSLGIAYATARYWLLPGAWPAEKRNGRWYFRPWRAPTKSDNSP